MCRGWTNAMWTTVLEIWILRSCLRAKDNPHVPSAFSDTVWARRSSTTRAAEHLKEVHGSRMCQQMLLGAATLVTSSPYLYDPAQPSVLRQGCRWQCRRWTHRHRGSAHEWQTQHWKNWGTFAPAAALQLWWMSGLMDGNSGDKWHWDNDCWAAGAIRVS